MKLYTCSASGHWLGSESIVLAPDEDTARTLLQAELKDWGVELTREELELVRVPQTKAKAIVLFNGDY